MHPGCNRAQLQERHIRQQQALAGSTAPCKRHLQRTLQRMYASVASVATQHVADQPQCATELQHHPQQQQQQQLQHQHQRWRSDSRQQRQEQRRQQLWGDNSSSSVQHANPQLFPDSAAAALQRLQDKEPYIPANTAAGRDRQLTAHIKKRKHWAQLQLIWLDNSTNFSPVHLTATMSQLARLAAAQGVAAADRPELFKFSSAIMSSLQLLIDALDPRGSAQCLWAYAKLQSLSPHRSRSGNAAAHTLVTVLQQQHMQQLRPQELSQVAWGAAVLQRAGLNTPSGFWQCLQDRLVLLLPNAQPSEVACCLWASAKVHMQPHSQVISAVMQHVEDRIGEYKARELLQVLLAVAAWQCNPTPTWRDSCLQRLQQLVPGMIAHDISNTLLALSRLQIQPPSLLLHCLLQRLQSQLPRASREVLVTVPYALAKLQLKPGPGWWAGFLPYTTVALQSLNPAGLAVLAWSLARLGIYPGQSWVDELLLHSGYKLRGFAAQELSMLVWAAGHWQAASSESWWQRFEQVSIERCEDFTAAELGALFMGVAGMTTRHPLVIAAPAAGTAEELHHFKQQQLEQAQQQVHNASAQHLLSTAWSAKLLAAAQSDLSGAPAECLAGIIMGLAKLGVKPSLAWLKDFEAAAAAALPDASIGNAAAVLWAYAVLEVRPSRHLVIPLNNRLCELLQADCSSSSEGEQQVAESTPAARAATRYVTLHSTATSPAEAAALSGPTPAVAAQLLWSLAQLPDADMPSWLYDLPQAVMPSLDIARCSTRTLVMLLWGLAKLGATPRSAGWLDVWWAAYMASLAASHNNPNICAAFASHGLHATASAAEVLEAADESGVAQQQVLQSPSAGNAQDHCPACSSQAAADTSLSLITAVLWSFNRLHVTPSSHSWLSVVLWASKPLLPVVTGQAFAAMLGQLVRLKVWPGEVWLSAAAAALLQKWQHKRDERDVLLKALGCMYRLGFVPPVKQAAQLKALVLARN